MPFTVAVAMADKLSRADLGRIALMSGGQPASAIAAVGCAAAPGRVTSGSVTDPRSRSAYGSSSAVIQIATEPVTWHPDEPGWQAGEVLRVAHDALQAD